MLAQNGAESISIDMLISYLKNMLPIERRNIYEKGYSIDKSFLSKVSSSNTLRSPIDVLEKPVCCLTLDLKTKLITSESPFMRSLSRVVV